MSKHLQRDLESLEGRLLAMSSVVEGMIEQACQALVSRDLSAVPGVIESESEIDAQEVAIEEECLKILALHQPVASDLRRVTTLLKINNELERIADLAVNLCDRAESFQRHVELPLPETVPAMSRAAVQMVRQSLDAFVNENISLAAEVITRDQQVDKLHRETIGVLMELMSKRPEIIEPAIDCFSAARHIERIADHATNISEDVIYLVEGEIARHKQELPSAAE